MSNSTAVEREAKHYGFFIVEPEELVPIELFPAGRKCESCQATLSQYNPGSICRPCSGTVIESQDIH